MGEVRTCWLGGVGVLRGVVVEGVGGGDVILLPARFFVPCGGDCGLAMQVEGGEVVGGEGLVELFFGEEWVV